MSSQDKYNKYRNKYNLLKSNIIFDGKSKYQKIQIFNDKEFGKTLVIDNDVQLTDSDEKHYHEMIVHVPINYFGNKKINVLIVGGGDGGALREVVRHNNVSNVIMVELDEMVVEKCKQYMPNISNGAYDDPRVSLIIEDGKKFVDSYKGNKFDLILLDLTDFGSSHKLYTMDFYNSLKNICNRDYLISFNADNFIWNEEYIIKATTDLVLLFKYVVPYIVYVPSYEGGFYSYCLLSDTISPKNFNIDWTIWENKNIETVYYNNDIHIASFAIPNNIKLKLDKIINKSSLKSVGIHYLLDINNIDKTKVDINNELALNDIFVNAIKIANMTILGNKTHHFSPHGITGIYLLSESHLSYHTWPESNFISLDLYTCGDHTKAYNAIQYIIRTFDSLSYKLNKIIR